MAIWTTPKSWTAGELVSAVNLNLHLRDNLQALKDLIDNFASLPAGTISAYGGAAAPAGYFMCDGTAVSRASYPNLFAALGTNYGVGDNSTTFNLPDLRGRMPVGVGQVAGITVRGANDGVSVVSRGPKHNHTVTDNGHTHGLRGGDRGSGAYAQVAVGQDYNYMESTADGGSISAALTGVAVGISGGTLDAPAFQAVNFIVKY